MANRIKQLSVRWADKTYDHNRVCDECGLETCPNPVHKDYYKEIITKQTYWNYVAERSEDEYRPSELNRGTVKEFEETILANPDGLEGKEDDINR